MQYRLFILLLLIISQSLVFGQIEELPETLPPSSQPNNETQAQSTGDLLSFQNLTSILAEIKANPNTLKAMKDIKILEEEYKGELFLVGQTVQIKGVRYSRKEKLKIWVKSLEGIESQLTAPPGIADAFDDVSEYDYIELKATLEQLSSDNIVLTVTEFIGQRPFDPKAELINYNEVIKKINDPEFLYPKQQNKGIQGLKIPEKLFRASPLSTIQSQYYMKLGSLRGTFKRVEVMDDHISMTMEVEGEVVMVDFPFKERPFLELAKAGADITVVARAIKFDPVKGSYFKYGAYFPE